MKKEKQLIKILLSVLLFASCGVILCLILLNSKLYPLGNDVYGHWFKTNVLYNAIKNGTLFPTYTEYWYNGVDLFRYWPPASYYFLAFIMFLTNGSLDLAYPIFAGLIFFIGGCGWLLFGYREDKIGLSTLLGFLFFFLPDNARVFFNEGNVPRIFITALLPYLFFFLFEFVKYKKKLALIPLSIITSLIVFTHIMISAMVGISSFLVLLIYSLTNKEYRNSIIALIDMVLAYVMMGIILVPGLLGGIISQNSSASIQTSADWSQNLLLTLNPLFRLESLGNFYFGLSIFAMALIGLIIGNKSIKPFFLSALLIFASTSSSLVHIISMLPLSQVFWMQRFIPMALVFILIGILYWKKCKKNALTIFLLCIIIDSSPALLYFNNNINYEENVVTIQEREKFETDYMLNEAESIVDNRVSLLDLSNSGSYSSFYFSRNLNKYDATKYMFGWAYQGAYTEKEIVRINEAFEYGFYNYTFDRLLEFGCDTVIVKKNEIGNHLSLDSSEKINQFVECAKKFGYEIINETDSALLLKYQLDDGIKSFGTILDYSYIAIGSGAHYAAYICPSFKIGDSICLDDYTFEELSQYSKIYLSDFTYKNKEKAEALLVSLANKDIDIYIDMNNIQENELTQKKEFLGVYAQFITFTNAFPIIQMDNGHQFKLEVGTKDYSPWYCSYLSGNMENIKAAPYKTDVELPYYGTSHNGKIHYMGFNLLCYYISDKTQELEAYMNELFDFPEDSMIPNRKIVPIDISYDYNNIVIHSDYDNVNTNLSNLNGFETDSKIKEEHHLMIVNKGETNITVTYPYFTVGILVSIFGILSTIILYIYVFISAKKNGA